MTIPFEFIRGQVTMISNHGVKLDHQEQWYTRDDKFQGGEPTSLDGSVVTLKCKRSRNGGVYYHGVEVHRDGDDSIVERAVAQAEGSFSAPPTVAAQGSDHAEIALMAAVAVMTSHPIPRGHREDTSDPAIAPDVAFTAFRQLMAKHVVVLAMTFSDFLNDPGTVSAAMAAEVEF